MKQKFFKVAMLAMGTIALATVASCSSDEPESGINPNPNVESVKTTFAISVPTAATGAKSRQTAEVVQATGTFRGIKNIKLIPYEDDHTTYSKVISLANFGTFDNQYTVGTSANTDGGYKLYSNVDIKVGTKNFLFYAEAAASSTTADALNGKLTSTIPSSGESMGSGNIYFTLGQIPSNGLEANKTSMINYLKRIADTSCEDESGTTIQWSNYNDNADLYKLYYTFTNQKAGSKVAIWNTLDKLITELNKLNPNASGSTVQRLAKAIIYNINNSDEHTAKPSFVNFPEHYGLPQGCLALSWNGSTFTYSALTTTNPNITLDNINYPAALYYWVNTPLKATDAANITSWPTSLNDWKSGFTDWGGEVLNSTHTIALQNNIQYAVAQLRTDVQCKAEVTTLEDNKAAHFPEGDNLGNTVTNQNIDIPTDGFKITGIIIGGQPSKVGYDFKGTSLSDITYDQNIYDRASVVYAKSGTKSDIIYTLVLDNNAGIQKDVNIAIEVENNTNTDFYGVDGIVSKNSKFYLIGKLDLQNNTNKTDEINRVFIQDYYTEAHITINSLQKAYVTIPDLTAAQLQLGLVVDLYWQAGLTFEVEIE